MPNIQLMSDVHFEFHRDGGKSFVASLDPTGVDVLVLAGDIGVLKDGSLGYGLELLRARYGEVPFVLVLGNHEYYGISRAEAQACIQTIQNATPHVHFLENDTVTLAGQRFVGCTLWFPDLPGNPLHESWLTDFHVIKGFRDWNYAACETSKAFLRDTVQQGDFVVTHHIPDLQGVHPRWRQEPHARFNRFFLCQLPQEVLSRAAYWAFGHTHDSIAFQVGACQFRCNPAGYAHQPNLQFDSHLVLGGVLPIVCPHCKQLSEWPSDQGWLYGPEVRCPHCEEFFEVVT